MGFFKSLFSLSIILFLLFLIVYTYYRAKKIDFEWKWILIPTIMFIVGFFGFKALEPDLPIQSLALESEAVPETVPETTTPATVAPVTTESADDFMASCQEIGYKSLLRTPDDYIGQRLVITAKVQQVMEGGLFDSSKYYRVQTDNDGYEAYYDDEYFMYDFRMSDTTKLLKDDVLKIYAEFAGLEEVRRALTGTTEEVPAIKAYYAELISE